MLPYKIISSDSHVYEPPDLWTRRINDSLASRAPRVVRHEDGDWWYCEGKKMLSTGPGSQTGKRFDQPQELTNADTFEHVRLGGYIPEEHIKDMDLDGVYGGVLYPTVAALFYRIVEDSILLSSICKNYNDWLAEFCHGHPKRLKGITIINVDDVSEGVEEMKRGKQMGLAGAMIPVYPLETRSYDRSEYDPLWDTAQALDIPLSLHVGALRAGQDSSRESRFTLADKNFISTDAFRTNFDHWVRMSLSNMIFSGVFERFPRLKVGSVEHELSWIPHFLDRLDYTYTQRAPAGNRYKFKDGKLPSDFFHQNVFCSFQEDALGIRDRHIIGVDNLMWGSDYPHHESTFPRTQEILLRLMQDVPEEEQFKILGGNADTMYHFT